MSAAMTRIECLRHAITTASGLPWEEIASARRTAKYIVPRWVAGLIMRERLGMSYPAIGWRMGRDHSSVIYGCAKVLRLMDTPGEDYARDLYAIANKALDDLEANKPVFVQISAVKAARQCNVWTPERTSYLIEHFASQSNKKIAQATGLSVASIKTKANELGLYKGEEYKAALSAKRTQLAYRLIPDRKTPVFRCQSKAIVNTPVGTAQDAAYFLQKRDAIWRCREDGRADQRGNFYMYLGRVHTPDEIIERAKAKQWQPWDMVA